MVDSRESPRPHDHPPPEPTAPPTTPSTPHSAATNVPSTDASTSTSPYKWRKRRKRKKRKPKKALFTKKKVRTTTSNIRIPREQRRKLYRDRCRQKKALVLQGRLSPEDRLPLIDHENASSNLLPPNPPNDDRDRDRDHTVIRRRRAPKRPPVHRESSPDSDQENVSPIHSQSRYNLRPRTRRQRGAAAASGSGRGHPRDTIEGRARGRKRRREAANTDSSETISLDDSIAPKPAEDAVTVKVEGVIPRDIRTERARKRKMKREREEGPTVDTVHCHSKTEDACGHGARSQFEPMTKKIKLSPRAVAPREAMDSIPVLGQMPYRRASSSTSPSSSSSSSASPSVPTSTPTPMEMEMEIQRMQSVQSAQSLGKLLSGANGHDLKLLLEQLWPRPDALQTVSGLDAIGTIHTLNAVSAANGVNGGNAINGIYGMDRLNALTAAPLNGANVQSLGAPSVPSLPTLGVMPTGSGPVGSGQVPGICMDVNMDPFSSILNGERGEDVHCGGNAFSETARGHSSWSGLGGIVSSPRNGRSGRNGRNGRNGGYAVSDRVQPAVSAVTNNAFDGGGGISYVVHEDARCERINVVPSGLQLLADVAIADHNRSRSQ